MAQTLHVVSHTHWDREWYFTFQQFRYRLVHLVDQLLEILESDPAFRHFHLDGQAVVLEDYLEIRPENRDRLRRLIQEGRLLAGPWYVLPDEFLVDGESIIRNLLAGRRVMAEFGPAMPVGYLPDLFGHLSQMPQMLAGFGLESAVIWRGISGSPSELPTEVRWRSPDGTEVFAIHLLDQYGYSNGMSCPADEEAGAAFLEARARELAEYATTSHLLLMNGSDHQEAEPAMPRVIAAANRRSPHCFAVHSSLPAYIEAARAEVAARAGGLASAPVLHGELRHTNFSPKGRFNFVLPGVLSSRIYLKQWNHRVLHQLERWSEPLTSMAAALGIAPPHALLRKSWKYLLQNQPHDSIGGCSIDAVHRHMLARFESAWEIALQAAQEARQDIAERVDLSFLERPAAKPGTVALVVFNPLQWPATEVVEAEVAFPSDTPLRDVAILTPDGEEIPHTLVELGWRHELPNRRGKWPPAHGRTVRTARIRFCAAAVPPCGYRSYAAVPLTVPNRRWAFPKPSAEAVLENEFLRVELLPNGSFDLLHKETGRWYRSLHLLEDGGDAGDSYSYSEPRADRVITSCGAAAEISRMEASPVATIYRVSWRLELPVSLRSDRQARAAETVPCEVASVLTLGRHSRRLDIETTVENRARDHRLRVLFPTRLQADTSHAAMPFDVVERPVAVAQPPREVWIEDEPVTWPMQGFVDVTDGQAGLAVLTSGLPEYAVVGPERTIALTLLRAVGYLGGAEPLTIMAGAGPHIETPEAQCLGRHTFRYAICPHAGDWTQGALFREAAFHQTPLEAHSVWPRRHEPGAPGTGPSDPSGRRLDEAGADPPSDGNTTPGRISASGGLSSGLLPVQSSFLQIEPAQLVLSAWKRAEERPHCYIIRLFNPASQAVRARIDWSGWLAAGTAGPGGASRFAVRAAHRVDLREERTASLPVAPGETSVELEVGAKQIVSIELETARV